MSGSPSPSFLRWSLDWWRFPTPLHSRNRKSRQRVCPKVAERRFSILSGRGPILLAVPTAATVALAIAVLAGGLAIGWFLLGAMVAGPLVVAAIRAVDAIRLQHR